MSFRGRLRVFFAIIVIGPVLAIALVAFALTERSERGKADAAISTGLRTTLGLYAEACDSAEPHLVALTRDPQLRQALAGGDVAAARARMTQLAVANPQLVGVWLRSPDGGLAAQAGSADAVAPASAPLRAADGRRVGTLSASVTRPGNFVRRAAALSGLDVSLFRARELLASTLPGRGRRTELGPADRSRDFELGGREYRGRVEAVREGAGPATRVVVFRDASDSGDAVNDSRLLIGAIILFGLLVALACSVFVIRGLQRQIGEFLEAARRLGRGDFTHPVPTQGDDEFAALGREFNNMSGQLAAKIDEVQRKRGELEETIRRVGEAFASGLDRQGVVELTVQTAVEACEAQAGRALPTDREAFLESRVGPSDGALQKALEAAERDAFAIHPDVGRELLEAVDENAPRPSQAPAKDVETAGVHALAVALRARLGSRSSASYAGVISIARDAKPFSREDRELLEYLAGQAVVSIENSDLHQTVQRQAVTDELTGLANVRELHSTLEREVERSRRFTSPLGLVMLDIDDFKKVNDTYGHQQGDAVLAGVATVLRELSRDIDEPSRYGGEELAVVLPETDSRGAAQLAERMREAIERLRVPLLKGGGHLTITASFGVASIPDNATDERSLIAAADAALYTAKRAGKNRVRRADPLPAPR